jgi:hypothetical protein
MARSFSLSTGLRVSALVLVGAVGAFAGCGSDEDGDSTGAAGPGGPGSSSSSGSGASGGETSLSTSSATTGGSGGEPTGGAGGTAGSGATGGSATGGTGGTGGAATGGAGGTSTGGAGGSGGVPIDQDQDGDGWTPADGDCCDVASMDCAEPEKVNPGAFEYLGNIVDDDCDANTPDNVAAADCGGMPLQTPTSSVELVKAIDLCQITTDNPPLPNKKWGVISSSLLRADGTNAAPDDVQVGVLAAYGTNVAPKKYATMAALSSGTARAPSDPDYVHPQNGTQAGQIGNYNAGHESGVPPVWLANQTPPGVVPSPANCAACTSPNCTKAFDSVNLKVKIRVPTNALSFSYNFKFYSSEFPEYVCKPTSSGFNDFFLALLTSTEPSIPADKNIAFDSGMNEVSVNNGFLDVCFPPPASPPGTCPQGTLELDGNGMGGWGLNLKDGGGTVWLTNDAPIVPGETMEIEFIIWDAEDHNVDSLVLLDNFRWDIDPSPVGTHD